MTWISEPTREWAVEALAREVSSLHEAVASSFDQDGFMPNFLDDYQSAQARAVELGVDHWESFLLSCTTAEQRDVFEEMCALYAPGRVLKSVTGRALRRVVPVDGGNEVDGDGVLVPLPPRTQRNA